MIGYGSDRYRTAVVTRQSFLLHIPLHDHTRVKLLCQYWGTRVEQLHITLLCTNRCSQKSYWSVTSTRLTTRFTRTLQSTARTVTCNGTHCIFPVRQYFKFGFLYLVKMDRSEKKQADRAYLRKRTLQAWLKLQNTAVDIEVVSGKDTLSANFRSIQADEETLHVSNLQTPLGCVREALVRGNDVEQLSFCLKKEEINSERLQ